MAFTNGHLLFAFFLMPLMAGVLLLFLKYVSGMELGGRAILYFIFAGTILGGFGVLVYTMNLFWLPEAIGLALLVISIFMITLIYFAGNMGAKKFVSVSGGAKYQ